MLSMIGDRTTTLRRRETKRPAHASMAALAKSEGRLVRFSAFTGIPGIAMSARCAHFRPRGRRARGLWSEGIWRS
jgi:hypothetical protein